MRDRLTDRFNQDEIKKLRSVIERKPNRNKRGLYQPVGKIDWSKKGGLTDGKNN